MVFCCMILSSCLISSLSLQTHCFWVRLNIPPSCSKCISRVWFAHTVKERLASCINNPGYEMEPPPLVFLTFIFLYFHICSTKPCTCGRMIGEHPCSLISFHIHRNAVHHEQLLDCPKKINLHCYLQQLIFIFQCTCSIETFSFSYLKAMQFLLASQLVYSNFVEGFRTQCGNLVKEWIIKLCFFLLNLNLFTAGYFQV